MADPKDNFAKAISSPYVQRSQTLLNVDKAVHKGLVLSFSMKETLTYEFSEAGSVTEAFVERFI